MFLYFFKASCHFDITYYNKPGTHCPCLQTGVGPKHSLLLLQPEKELFFGDIQSFFFTILICICKCNEQGIIALVSLILKGSSKINGKFAQTPLKQILLTERKRKFLFSPYLGGICVRTLPLPLPHFLLQKP